MTYPVHTIDCDYCVAAHSVIAQLQKVPDAIVQAIRDGAPIADRKLEALRRLTVSIVQSRGWPAAATLEAFLDAGYTQAQVLEVVLGVGAKTLSNYTNHLTDTPLDRAFANAAWRIGQRSRVRQHSSLSAAANHVAG